MTVHTSRSGQNSGGVLMSAIVVLMSANGVLMSGQFFNDFSGHYVPHSARTSLGPKTAFLQLNILNQTMHHSPAMRSNSPKCPGLNINNLLASFPNPG